MARNHLKVVSSVVLLGLWGRYGLAQSATEHRPIDVSSRAISSLPQSASEQEMAGLVRMPGTPARPVALGRRAEVFA